MATTKNMLSKAAISTRAKDAFKAYRLQREWNHAEMAAFLDVGTDTYQKWEDPKQVKRYVSAETIALFCFHTDTDPGWILFGKKPLRKAI